MVEFLRMIAERSFYLLHPAVPESRCYPLKLLASYPTRFGIIFFYSSLLDNILFLTVINRRPERFDSEYRQKMERLEEYVRVPT